jgi:DNA-binding IclR family transcriptional regulator
MELEKALILFGRITRDRGRTALSELAADLRLPRSTLYRLTGTLQAFGLITRSARGHYDVGLKLADAMRGVTPAGQLARLSRPALQHLADASQATAHLGVLEDGMVTYLVKAVGKGADAAAVFTRENAQLEAYCSGIGKVLLAWQENAAREQYLAAGPFVKLTGRTISDPAALRACLGQVREDGFAKDDGEAADDLFCLAVPVRQGGDAVPAAISISFRRAECGGRAMAAELARLRRCTAALAGVLGWQKPGAADRTSRVGKPTEPM